MNNQLLEQLLNIFQLTRLKIHLELQQDVYLPAFSGSTVHGLLGQALRRYKPDIYTKFYGKKTGNTPLEVRPYAVCVNYQSYTGTRQERRGRRWQKGENFSFELKLFGTMHQHANDIIEAISLFGLAYGIGDIMLNSSSKYKVVSVYSVCRDKFQTGVHVYNLIDHINPQLLSSKIQSQQPILNLNSRLMIKKKNHLLKNEAPELKKIITQIHSRLENLTKVYQSNNTEFLLAIKNSLPSNFTSINNSLVLYNEWQRAKDKKGEMLNLSGLLGLLKYQILDESSLDIIPWLAVGQQLQIGGKTTFGLGDYSLIA